MMLGVELEAAGKLVFSVATVDLEAQFVDSPVNWPPSTNCAVAA